MKNELEVLKEWVWIARDFSGMLILSDVELVKDEIMEQWFQMTGEPEPYKVVHTEFCSPHLDFISWSDEKGTKISEIMLPEKSNKVEIKIEEESEVSFLIKVTTKMSEHNFVKQGDDLDLMIDFVNKQLDKDTFIIKSSETGEAVVIPSNKIEHVYVKKSMGAI